MFQNNNTNVPVRILEDASKIKDVAWHSINNILTSIIVQLPYMIAGLTVLFIFILISKGIKKIFWATTGKTNLDYRLRILISRLVGIAIVSIGFFTALTVVI